MEQFLGFAAGATVLVRDHPSSAVGAVFLVVFVESIAVVGLFIPGTSFLLAMGVLVGAAHLSAWPLVAAGSLGAIFGGNVSFAIGRRWKQRSGVSPAGSIARRASDRTLQFMARFGDGSIVIGRFLPVIRPTAPFLAGWAGMPLLRFNLLSVLSAPLWATTAIVPGQLAVAFAAMRVGQP